MGPSLRVFKLGALEEEAQMHSVVVKRSIVLAGHKTSVSLEDLFWSSLKDIAHHERVTLSDLVGGIASRRQNGNLSSAIRLFVLDHYRGQSRTVSARQLDADRRVDDRPASDGGAT
jgi:predicted DNA-binding ribbon-helix-helix protein